MYFKYSNNVYLIYAVPTAIIDLVCPSLERGFCTVEQSMNIINIPACSAINVVLCKNMCFKMSSSTLYVIKVKSWHYCSVVVPFNPLYTKSGSCYD